MKPIFVESDREAIRQATTAAETKTSGEIVSVVVRESDAYPELGLYSAVSVWVLVEMICFVLPRDPLTGLSYELVNPSSPWYAWLNASPSLFLPPLGFLLGLLLGRFDFVRRLWLGRRRGQEEVHQRAIQAFMETEAHETPDRSGILIFVSLFEHRCEIVADLGFKDKVSSDEWAAIVRRLTMSIRERGLRVAMIEAIEACGAIAAKHFPQNGEAKRNLDDNPQLP